MDDQCLIMDELGEVTKKRRLSEVDKGIFSSKKYMPIRCTADEDLTYEFKSAEELNHDGFSIEKLTLPNDVFRAKNIIGVLICKVINNTKINCINDNCLAKIFMYLPACERPKLALVCKKWKNVLDDSWYDVKKLELIYWQYDEYPNCLAKYSTSDGGYSFIKSLLNKCSRYLTKLDLTAYGHCKIVPVINELCPNLVTLRLRFTKMNKVILANSFTRLSKLKSLTIIFQNIKPYPLLSTVALMNSLRNVANTLTDLSLLYWMDELRGTPDFTAVIEDVLHDLKALKNLELAGVVLSQNVLCYLKDNNITYVNYTSGLEQYLPKLQPFIDIKSLYTLNSQIKDNSLYSIANAFKNLVSLQMYNTWVTDDGILALSKMNNLKILNFHGQCNNITDSSIKLLKNLVKLGLPTSNKITDESVITVLENSPKMDVLYIIGTNVTSEFVKKAAEISDSRKQRLILCIKLMPDVQQYESPYLELRLFKKINGTQRRVFDSAAAEIENSQRIQEGKQKFLEFLYIYYPTSSNKVLLYF